MAALHICGVSVPGEIVQNAEAVTDWLCAGEDGIAGRNTSASVRTTASYAATPSARDLQ